MPAKIRNKRKNERTYAIKPVQIMLKGQFYRLNDISNEGIGIVFDEDAPQFVIGERLEKIPIPLQSGTVNLMGTVSHISINADRKVCGIRFIFEGDDFSRIVQFKKECTYPLP
jgi:hypothetical protein